MTRSAQSIEQSFIVIDPQKCATIEKNDAGLYQRLESHYPGFKDHELISCHRFEQDWKHWEMHPHGDEIVILLSGRATCLLQVEDDIRPVELTAAGQFIIVPKAVWHTMNTDLATRMLFVTPGEGTRHRDRTGDS